jgi:hypothetical protein
MVHLLFSHCCKEDSYNCLGFVGSSVSLTSVKRTSFGTHLHELVSQLSSCQICHQDDIHDINMFLDEIDP